ncbi:MAG: hypothetical protein Edafosvirus3_68 [Edafosvirus sp.]|uniref:Uncharacterized protein n=1 Tax=Edafosvirus sp. TaxID=2487765 RepID=A0A3G4ZSV7_9VIRU|nr:MAG: hypothetical protein Edafosvirus3_68 [Edafosvirus sp.]
MASAGQLSVQEKYDHYMKGYLNGEYYYCPFQIANILLEQEKKRVKFDEKKTVKIFTDDMSANYKKLIIFLMKQSGKSNNPKAVKWLIKYHSIDLKDYVETLKYIQQLLEIGRTCTIWDICTIEEKKFMINSSYPLISIIEKIVNLYTEIEMKIQNNLLKRIIKKETLEETFIEEELKSHYEFMERSIYTYISFHHDPLPELEKFSSNKIAFPAICFIIGTSNYKKKDGTINYIVKDNNVRYAYLIRSAGTGYKKALEYLIVDDGIMKQKFLADIQKILVI